MKRIFVAAAAVALTAITTACLQAQSPPPGYGGMMAPNDPRAGQVAEANAKMEQYKSQYGLSPGIRRLLCGKDGSHCSTCAGGDCGRHPGLFSKICNKGQGPVPPPFPVGQGGTLVYPNHPFIRSPRDYFMID